MMQALNEVCFSELSGCCHSIFAFVFLNIRSNVSHQKTCAIALRCVTRLPQEYYFYIGQLYKLAGVLCGCFMASE